MISRKTLATEADAENSELVSEYFDNVDFRSGWDEASLVTVVAGQETTGINFDMDIGGSISGKVTTADGSPVSQERIQLRDGETGRYVKAVNTNTSGEYLFQGLPTGGYKVQVYSSESGLIDEFYQDAMNFSEAQVVEVVIGQDITGIDFSLEMGGAISGKVTIEADGTPVSSARVSLYNAENQRYVGTAWTDSNGQYQFKGLLTGVYKVKVEIESDELLDEFYEDALDFDTGQAIEVSAGQQMTDVDFTLATPEEHGYITEWLILGPINTESNVAQAVYTDLLNGVGGESQVTPSEGDVVDMDAEQLQWTAYNLSLDTDNLGEIYGSNRIATVYMAVYLNFLNTETTDLRIGSGDSVSVWLDGENVWRNPVERSLSLDEDRIQVDVNKGWNLLLMKVNNINVQDWGASARFPHATILESSLTAPTLDGETNVLPVAHFLANPRSGAPPLTVSFTDFSHKNPISWLWDFGDGGTSELQNPTYTYTKSGSYAVRLTTTNPVGTDTETKIDYVYVNKDFIPDGVENLLSNGGFETGIIDPWLIEEKVLSL